MSQGTKPGYTQVRIVTSSDIPAWIALSREYDQYVMEIAQDLTEWYEGSKTSMSFKDYMNAKISQKEAFIAFDQEKQDCLGIIAISIKNNRITFFAISHSCNFAQVGEQLLLHGLNKLNTNAKITINIIKSEAKQIQNQRNLFKEYGFSKLSDGLENGVSVDVMVRIPD